MPVVVVAVPGVNVTMPNVGPATGSAGYEAGLARQDEYTNNAVRTSDPQAGLRALAEDTGGFAIADTNDTRIPLRHVMEEVRAHYPEPVEPLILSQAGAYTANTAETIASVRNLSLDDIARVTTENARRLFRLPDQPTA